VTTDFPDLKMKALVNFPAQAYGRVGIDVNKNNGAFYLDLDYSGFGIFTSLPPDTTPYYSLLWNRITNSYQLCPFALTGVGGGAWTISTPIPAPSSGAFGAASSVLHATQSGKDVKIGGTITITTVGTATGLLQLPLPFVPAMSMALSAIYGTTGAAAGAWVTSGSAVLNIAPVVGLANGQTYYFGGTYEGQ
jgi:hypothetical protein